MPLAIGGIIIVGVLLFAFLSPMTSAAGELPPKKAEDPTKGGGGATTGGGGATNGGGGATNGGGGASVSVTIGLKELEEKAKSYLEPGLKIVAAPEVTAIPVPGNYYTINETDNGSKLTATAYGVASPYGFWVKHVVPANVARLGQNTDRWFQHLWTDGPACKWNAGGHEFATLYFPSRAEVGLE
jgi:hypothetical protein